MVWQRDFWGSLVFLLVCRGHCGYLNNVLGVFHGGKTVPNYGCPGVKEASHSSVVISTARQVQF